MLPTQFDQYEARRFMEDAIFSRDRGISIIPLDGKRPPRGISLKEYTCRHATDDEIREWSRLYTNIGNICGQISGVVGIDGDNAETVKWIMENLPRTSMMTRSSEGKGHFYYRIEPGVIVPPRVKIAGMALDVRGEVSLLVSARSIHPDTGRRYERVGTWKLEHVPYFDPKWLDRVESEHIMTRQKVRNVMAYLAKVESIQGQGGSKGLVRAAAICRDAGLSEAEAMLKLLAWNRLPVVDPDWPEDEIARAVTRTYQKGKP